MSGLSLPLYRETEANLKGYFVMQSQKMLNQACARPPKPKPFQIQALCLQQQCYYPLSGAPSQYSLLVPHRQSFFHGEPSRIGKGAPDSGIAKSVLSPRSPPLCAKTPSLASHGSDGEANRTLGILVGVVFCLLLKLFLVALVLFGNAHLEWIIRLRLDEQVADRLEHPY